MRLVALMSPFGCQSWSKRGKVLSEATDIQTLRQLTGLKADSWVLLLNTFLPLFLPTQREVAGTSWSKTLWSIALSEITYKTSEKMLEVITEQFYLWFESLLIRDFIAEEFFDWTQSEIYTYMFCFKCFLHLKIRFLQYCIGMLPCTLCYATSVYFEISDKNPGAFNQNMN